MVKKNDYQGTPHRGGRDCLYPAGFADPRPGKKEGKIGGEAYASAHRHDPPYYLGCDMLLGVSKPSIERALEHPAFERVPGHQVGR